MTDLASMDKLSIKIILGFFSNRSLIELIAVREDYLRRHQTAAFLVENRTIIESDIPDWYKKKYCKIMRI